MNITTRYSKGMTLASGSGTISGCPFSGESRGDVLLAVGKHWHTGILDCKLVSMQCRKLCIETIASSAPLCSEYFCCLPYMVFWLAWTYFEYFFSWIQNIAPYCFSSLYGIIAWILVQRIGAWCSEQKVRFSFSKKYKYFAHHLDSHVQVMLTCYFNPDAGSCCLFCVERN